MEKVINFEDKKLDIELTKVITEYETIMPSLDEIDRRIDCLRKERNFTKKPSDSDYVWSFKELFFSVFDDFVEAYRRYDPKNEFSKRAFTKKMFDYDIVLTMLDTYIDERYNPPYDDFSQFVEIEEIENIINGVEVDYENLTLPKLKKRIETYINITKQVYNVIFAMLEKEDSRCINWAGIYSFSIPHISYHVFERFLVLEDN